jgi:hypothetical protein
VVQFVNSLIRDKKTQFPADTPNMITGDRCLQIAIDNQFYGFSITPDYRGFLIQGEEGAGTAEGEIAQFDWADIYDRDTSFLDSAADDFGSSIQDNLQAGNGTSATDRAPIDTFPVCKDQDPSIANYSEKDLLSILTAK